MTRADEAPVEVSGRPAASRLHVLHPARVEVEPEHRSTGAKSHLSANLHDIVALVFFIGACLAQAADAVTTAFALQTHALVEANPLMRSAVTQPVITGALKVLIVVLLSLLAMMRLPTRYARLALLLAFGISALAPIQNAVQLLTAH